MPILILVAVFVAVAGSIVGVYLFANRRALSEAAVIRSRIHGDNTQTVEYSILKDQSASQVPFLNQLLQGRAFTETIQQQLERAGSTQKPAVFLLTVAVLGAGGIAAAVMLDNIIGVVPLAIGLTAPWLWLVTKQRRRLAAFEAKFPDTLDMMANGMRAGYSFQAAAHFIGDEVPAPIGPEFARFYEEQRLGVDVRTALLGMQNRVDSVNTKMFVTAVLIQRETGGNLTELLENLSTLMRERVALHGQIQTLTAEPKLSARFLAALPVFLFFGLRAVNPGFMAPFSESTVGHLMLGGTAVAVVIGYYLLMRIADIDV